MRGFLQRILQDFMTKNITWNIRRLVDESFVPSAKQTSVLYCRLTDFYASPKVNSEKLLSRKLHKICTLRHTSKEKEKKKKKLTEMSSAKTIFPLGKWFRFPCPDPGQDIISRIERYIRVNSVEMIIRKVRFFKILV